MRALKPILLVCGAMLLTLISAAQVQTFDGMNISDSAVETFIRQEMDSLSIPALSIAFIAHGKVVYVRTLGVTSLASKQPVDRSSIFEAASLSKTMFAWFVLRLVDRRVLSLDTPLYRYLPYPDIEQDKRYKLITARMVLSHTTGFPNWRHQDKPDTSLHVSDGSLYLKFTPGTRFSYSGEGYQYLAKVVARLYQTDLKGLERFFEQEVVKPLGLKHTYYCWGSYLARHKVTGHVNGQPDNKWPSRDSTEFGAAGLLHTDARNYARFLVALMKEEGLTGSLYKQMFSSQISIPKDNSFFTGDNFSAWGLGVGIEETPYGRAYRHDGNNGNFQSGFLVFKARQSGYVFFTNCDKGGVFNKKLRQFLQK